MDEWVIVNNVYVCKVTNLADFEKISKKKCSFDERLL